MLMQLATNGGAYPLYVCFSKLEKGGNYIYSVLVGYEDPPPVFHW